MVLSARDDRSERGALMASLRARLPFNRRGNIRFDYSIIVRGCEVEVNGIASNNDVSEGRRREVAQWNDFLAKRQRSVKKVPAALLLMSLLLMSRRRRGW
jgi:hypothetical protein